VRLLDCQTALALANRLWDMDLSDLEQADLQLHLAGCPDCRAAVDDLFALRRALVLVRENPLDPPSGLAAGVMDRVAAVPRLTLAVARTRGALARRLEDAGAVFKTPGRLRTALAAAALALVTIATGTSLYLNHLAAPVTVAQNNPPKTTVTTPNPAPPTQGNAPLPNSRSQVQPPAPQNQTQVASTGTMTSVWLSADDLQAINRQLSTAAARYKADYHVYSLAGAPGGQNREFVRIAVDPQASPAIMDKIRSSAAAVDRVVQNDAGSGGQDVIIAWVNGSSR